MNYCFHYNKSNPHLLKATEWIFSYREDNPNLIMKMRSLKEEGATQRIIIDITEFGGEPNWDILSASVQEYPNSAILITKNQITLVPAIRLHNMKWFLINGCYTWDMLKECIDFGVTDVYITNELGFDIKNVKSFCDKNNIKVRAYPNIAQTSAQLLTLGNYKSFYIRPEDVELYEKYINIFEFFPNEEKERVLYEIYENREWRGDIHQLILNLPFSRNLGARNNYIPTIFGYSRLDCKKKCVYGNCQICDNCITAAQSIKERRVEETNKLREEKQEDGETVKE